MKLLHAIFCGKLLIHDAIYVYLPNTFCFTSVVNLSLVNCILSMNCLPYNASSIFCSLHHRHQVVLLARISLILSRHFSLSFIASGRSSELHPVSSQSCCMYVLAGRPAFARPYVGVHRSTSLMSSSLLLQQCPACLVRLTWIVFVIGGRIVGALWGVAARTYSILLVTFLYNCRLASSRAVLLASKWCIHTAVSTRPLPGRNCVSFYRSGLISIWLIAYR